MYDNIINLQDNSYADGISGSLHNEIVSVSGNLVNIISSTSGYLQDQIDNNKLYTYTIPPASSWYLNNMWYQLPISGVVTSPNLIINGIQYASGNFALSGDPLSIKWLNIVQYFRGFNLSNHDSIVFTYNKV